MSPTVKISKELKEGIYPSLVELFCFLHSDYVKGRFIDFAQSNYRSFTTSTPKSPLLFVPESTFICALTLQENAKASPKKGRRNSGDVYVEGKKGNKKSRKREKKVDTGKNGK